MKKIVSLLLAVCMVLSVVPTMAATITLKNNPNYLKAPIELTYASTGAYSGYQGYNGPTVSFVLGNGAAVADALGFKLEKSLLVSAYNTGNNFDGLVVNGDITYSGTAAAQNPDGSFVYENDGTTLKKEEFSYTYKLVDAPVIGLRSNSAGTALVVEINDADYYDATGTVKIGVTRRFVQPGAKLCCEKLLNAVLSNKSQKEGNEFNTGKFPEGTIFISVTELVNEADSVWPGNLTNCISMTNNENPYRIWDENNVAMTKGVGPSAVFKSKVSGTYDIWVMRADLDKTNSTTRAAKFYIDKNLYTSTQRPDDFAGTGAKDRYFFWSNQGSSVTLTKDQKFKVQYAAQADTYCRLAIIALVPSDANFDLPLTSTDIYSGPTAISQDTAVALRELYLDKVQISKDPVKATVNGTEYSVTATSICTDIFGDDIVTPTVYDAILAAGFNTKADGTTAEYITVNGKEVVNVHKIKLNENDVINVSDATVGAFSPISLKNLFAAVGANDARKVKLCLKNAELHNAKMKFALTYSENGSYVENENPEEGILGAYLTGYLFASVDYTINGLTVPANTKQLLTHPEGHKFDVYDTKANSRLDVFMSNLTYKDKENVVTALPGSTTEAVWLPYHMSSNPTLDKSNLYIVDSNTTFDVEVLRKGDKYAITSDGAASVTVIVATYGENKNVIKTEINKTVVVTPINPYVGTVADSQKVFVWKEVPYNGTDAVYGTTMVPVCAPITK